MMIKKQNTTMTFHSKKKAMSTGTLEFEYVSGGLNYSDFLTKTVDNEKFILLF